MCLATSGAASEDLALLTVNHKGISVTGICVCSHTLKSLRIVTLNLKIALLSVHILLTSS